MHHFIIASLSLFYYISVPVTEMREQPSKDSEVVSQAYFSEEIRLLQEKKDWVKVETVIDHYQGWIPKNNYCQRESIFPPPHKMVKVNRCAAHLYSVQDIIYGPLMTLPYESKLELLDDSDSRWIKVGLADGREAFMQRGDLSFAESFLNREQMCQLSHQFLGLPYTWGGRSSFGYDCSGFVQMLYRQMGVFLPRDAKDQIRWVGFAPIPLEALQPGDLIFFGLSEDAIRHVGMSLGNQQFIHATIKENKPYLRLSSLSEPEWNGLGGNPYRAARKLAKI